MAEVIFRFLRPNSLIGHLITWRLGEPWSHVSIIIDDAAYSAQLPWVAMLPITDKSVAMPPRSGYDVVLHLNEQDTAKLKQWCESKVGTMYDILSIFGWILGWEWLQSKRNSYCFEYCFQALVYMGWLKPDDELIKGNKLIEDIESLIHSPNINLPCDATICKHDHLTEGTTQ